MTNHKLRMINYESRIVADPVY